MKLLEHFFDGLLLIGSSYTDSRAYKIDRQGFLNDSLNLAGDVRVVGSDIRSALRKVEKDGEAYPSQGSKLKLRKKLIIEGPELVVLIHSF